MSRSHNEIKNIVIVGSVNADVFLHVDRLPAPGETIGCRTEDTGYMLPGGKGANQAVAAQRLQPDHAPCVDFIGSFGNDAHNSPVLRQALVEEGVCCDASQVSSVASGQAFIFLDSSGENSILLSGGANQRWTAVTSAMKAKIDRAAVVMLQREIPDAINLEVAEYASARGVLVIADAGGYAGPLSKAFLSRVDFFCPNETELARLAEMPTDTKEDVVAAARHMQREYEIKNVLVSRGTEGSLLLDEHGNITECGCYTATVLDTTGAGDCFRAAFAVALVEGKSIDMGLDWAAAAASLAVESRGAMTAMPSREQTFARQARGRAAN